MNGGYERFGWATICREVAKLRVEILGGQVLALDLSTASVTAREEGAESLEKRGEGRRTRTFNQRIKSPMLYH